MEGKGDDEAWMRVNAEELELELELEDRQVGKRATSQSGSKPSVDADDLAAAIRVGRGCAGFCWCTRSLPLGRKDCSC